MTPTFVIVFLFIEWFFSLIEKKRQWVYHEKKWGLQKVRSKLIRTNWRRLVEIESDALLVIKTIEAGNWHLSPEGHIFEEITLIAAQLEEVSFKKIPRLWNEVAHSLAKAASPLLGCSPWLKKLFDDVSSWVWAVVFLIQ